MELFFSILKSKYSFYFAILLLISGAVIIQQKDNFPKLLFMGIFLTALGSISMPLSNQLKAEERGEKARKSERLLEMIHLMNYDLKPDNKVFYLPIKQLSELRAKIIIGRDSVNSLSNLYVRLKFDRLYNEHEEFKRNYYLSFQEFDFLVDIVENENITSLRDEFESEYVLFQNAIFESIKQKDKADKILFNAFDRFQKAHKRILANLKKEQKNLHL